MTRFANADALAAAHSVAAAHVMLLALLPRGAPSGGGCYCTINTRLSFAI
jgi:hypothetical protein